MDWFFNFLLSKPQRLMELGKVLMHAGSTLLIAGLLAAVGTQAVGIVTTLGKGARPEQLSDWLTGVPTWWVPESAASFAALIAVTTAGIVAMLTARKYEQWSR